MTDVLHNGGDEEGTLSSPMSSAAFSSTHRLQSVWISVPHTKLETAQDILKPVQNDEVLNAGEILHPFFDLTG